MSDKRDYYEVLGISREASGDEIRRAYKQAALKYHPDRNPGDKNAEDRFKEATEAYSVLSDDSKRSAYDRFGHAGLEGAGFDFSGAGIGDVVPPAQLAKVLRAVYANHPYEEPALDIYPAQHGSHHGLGRVGARNRLSTFTRSLRMSVSLLGQMSRLGTRS